VTTPTPSSGFAVNDALQDEAACQEGPGAVLGWLAPFGLSGDLMAVQWAWQGLANSLA
jgi:hypothetical protein